MKRFQGRIPLVNTFGKASLHPVDGTPALLTPFALMGRGASASRGRYTARHHFL